MVQGNQSGMWKISFCTSIEVFLGFVLKRVIIEKWGGNSDEKDSDSVSKQSYEHIYLWVIERDNCLCGATQ